MHARVWKFAILPGKVAEFAATAKFAKSVLRKEPGYRGFLVLHSGPGEKLEATVVSVWESLVALRDSENSGFKEALARAMAFCEPRPTMREEEVVLSDFIAPDPDDTLTDL
jgi:heme-degrading monooxygenase HmoA